MNGLEKAAPERIMLSMGGELEGFRGDEADLAAAIDRKAEELRAMGFSEEQAKRATDPLRSFCLHETTPREEAE